MSSDDGVPGINPLWEKLCEKHGQWSMLLDSNKGKEMVQTGRRKMAHLPLAEPVVCADC